MTVGTLPRERKALLPFFYLAVISVFLIASLGRYDLHTRGEAREALVIKRIVETGEWIVTRGYGEAIASKPPLLHWLGASFSVLRGAVDEFTVRLPSTLAAIVGISIFLFVLRNELGVFGQSAFVLLLFFSFEWARAASTSRVDMVHSAALSAGVIAAFQAYRSGAWVWWGLSSLSIALAILGKGPVGLILPALILFVWSLTAPRGERGVTPQLVATLVVGGCLGAVWYVLAFSDGNDEFMSRVTNENFARFTSTEEFQPHKHSVPFLMLLFILGLMPWSGVAFVAGAVSGKLGAVSSSLRSDWRAHMASLRADALARLCIVAIGVIVLFYSVPAGKRGVYLLAAYPFIAIMTARIVQSALTQWTLHVVFGLGITCIVLAQFVIIPRYMAPRSSERTLARTLNENTIAGARVFSYGFEFYGASFYADRTIYRLEDALTADSRMSRVDPPTAGDIIVLFDHDRVELERFQNDRLTLMEQNADVIIGNDSVRLLKVVG